MHSFRYIVVQVCNPMAITPSTCTSTCTKSIGRQAWEWGRWQDMRANAMWHRKWRMGPIRSAHKDTSQRRAGQLLLRIPLPHGKMVHWGNSEHHPPVGTEHWYTRKPSRDLSLTLSEGVMHTHHQNGMMDLAAATAAERDPRPTSRHADQRRRRRYCPCREKKMVHLSLYELGTHATKNLHSPASTRAPSGTAPRASWHRGESHMGEAPFPPGETRVGLRKTG